ncbi:MAG: radical SAM protein [Lachnospiraceae bacterium]|nr:radical SAM protein [Lachnospiraceae bacterium]
MKYFKLFSNAKFDFDKKGGCVINLFDYSRINLDSCQAEKMMDLIKCPMEDFELLGEVEKSLALKLMNKGMGYLYENNIVNEEYLDNKGIEVRGLSENVPFFEEIYIQASTQCNGNCDFCKNNSNLIYGGCNSCICWKNNNEEKVILETTKMNEIMTRITKLFVKTIIFSGGNPFINWIEIKESIQLIRKNMKDVTIKIITNGSFVNDEILAFCVKSGVKLVFTILGHDEMSYIRITGNKNIYLDLINAVNSCIDKNVEYETNILAKSSDLEKIINFINMHKWNITSISEIYETNIPFKSIKSFDERINSNPSNLRKNQKFNTCLNNKLAINLYGSMQPCPMIEDKLVDLTIDDISKPFQTLLIDKYWRMTKQQVSSCSGCPYRFSCDDCTVIELAINSEKLNAEYICSR